MTNGNSKPPEQPLSWIRRIILIVVVSGVLAVLADLAWPTIEEPLGLAAVNLSRFRVAIIVAATFSITCFLVYFVANKTLWQFLDLLIVPLALAIIGFGFTAQQQVRQTQIEEQRAQNAALQAYLDQMNPLILEKHLLDSEEGDAVFTLAKARTTTVLAQLDGVHNQAVTRFLSDSGLLRKPALLAKADLQDAKLHKAVLQNANLADTVLKGANLTDAELTDADFSAEGQATTADLPKADLSRATLLGANLSGCFLKEATLTDANLQSADLSSADLHRADLSHAALQDADLSIAESTPNLQDKPLWILKELGTNLAGANLSHAALQHANLSGAVLQNADLTNTDLTNTNLTNAYLSDADLSKARGWTKKQLIYTVSLEGATMPDGQRLKSKDNPDGPTFEEWLKRHGKENSGS